MLPSWKETAKPQRCSACNINCSGGALGLMLPDISADRRQVNQRIHEYHTGRSICCLLDTLKLDRDALVEGIIAMIAEYLCIPDIGFLPGILSCSDTFEFD
jgi:hypothetical protein